MLNLPNIEKSGFRRGEYVGYAAGDVWRITKSTGRARWVAIARHNGQYVYGDTLVALSATLAGIADGTRAAISAYSDGEYATHNRAFCGE